MTPKNEDEEEGTRISNTADLPDFWNIIFVQGDITNEMSLHVCERLLSMEYINTKLEEPQPITMIINSPGGSVTSAWQICDMMDFMKSEIHTVGVGQISSAALLIFMNGSKGHRKVSNRCSIMSHRYTWGAEGKHTDLIAIRSEQDNTHIRILDHYKECTGQSQEYIEKYLLQEHDAWLTAEEAKKHKIVDSIVKSTKKKPLKRKAR
jgi:ATP-dependent Clp protease, protease subunit